MDVTLIGKDTQEMNAYNRQGNVNLFGAQLVPAPKEELEKLGLEAGVKVASIEKGKIRDAGIKEGFIITYINNTPVSSPQDVARDAGIKEGFIITYINNTPVSSPQDVAAEVKRSRRSLLIEGFYPDGNLYYYGRQISPGDRQGGAHRG